MRFDYNLILVLLIWLLFYISYKYFYAKAKTFPINDVGFIWIFTLILYGTIPYMSWYLQGQKFSILNQRLFFLDPEVENIRYILYLVLACMIGFMVIHSFLSNYFAYFNLKESKKKTPQPILFLSILIFVSIIIFESIFSGLINLESASTRSESYAIMNALPTGFRQVFRFISIFKNFTTIVLTVYIFQTWPRFKSILIFYIIYLVYFTFISGGRANLLLFLFSTLICYHVIVEKIKTRNIILFGFGGLTGFVLFGIFRQNNILDMSQLGGFGEFSNIWANAFKVQKSNELMPFSVRFNDFFSYVPSQFLWFNKESPSIWFLKTFYPGYIEAGHGLGFGIFAEIMSGYGILEAFIRGGLIAFFMFLIMKAIARDNYWWSFPLNIFLVLNIFQSIRDTSFRFITDIFQQMVIPTIIIICLQHVIFSIKYKNYIAESD